MKKRIISIILLLTWQFNFIPTLVYAQEQSDPTSDVSAIETGDIVLDAELANSSNENMDAVNEINTELQNEAALLLENSNSSTADNQLVASGTSGVNLIDSNEGDSYIYTGNISSDTVLENGANSNVTVYECVDCVTSTAAIIISAADNNLPNDLSSPEVASTSTSTYTLVQNDNQATTTNTENIMLTSGENEIVGASDALIDTGNVGIINIIVNFINSNFFGNGKNFFINIFNKVMGSIDLSGFGGDTSESGSCAGGSCDVALNNSNQSTIDNSIVIDANTGKNVLSNNGGESTIVSGDIDIVNDVLNIANVNVSGDEWFFAVVNIFGELDGDVVLPSAYEMGNENIDIASGTDQKLEKELIIANENASELINDIVVNANTGDNTIASATAATIVSGDVEIKSTIFNLINYNIIGDTWKFARVNVFGSWDGIIEGLPSQYNYLQDENGITIYDAFLDDYKVDAAYAQMLISNDNQATTTNQIEINADTGNNVITDGGESLISTGDINIQNSLVNFINSNFTGKNWEFSMVNVFGDWKGNLSFGQPELWITESIDKNNVQADDTVTYTFLFGNSGDATAKNVRIIDKIDESMVGALSENIMQDGMVGWDIGELPPNTQGSISYTVTVSGTIPLGNSTIVNAVEIMGNENERDYSNNKSGGTVYAKRLADDQGSSGTRDFGSGSNGSSYHPSLSVVKTNDAQKTLLPGDIVTYKIVIKNNGNLDAKDVLVLDVLRKQGDDASTTDSIKYHEEFWDLSTVKIGEEVIIEYSLEIKNTITSGIYNNEVMVEGLDQTNGKYVRAVASSKINVLNDMPILDSEEVAVLGYEGKPELMLRKVWPDEILHPGDVIKYQVVVKNNGDLDAFEVKLKEVLPPELRFVDSDKSEKIMDLGNLGAGEEISVNLEAYVLDTALAGEYETHTSVSATNNEEIKVVNRLRVEHFLSGESEISETLPETGFSLKEFFVLLFGTFVLIGVAENMRRRNFNFSNIDKNRDK